MDRTGYPSMRADFNTKEFLLRSNLTAASLRVEWQPIAHRARSATHVSRQSRIPQ